MLSGRHREYMLQVGVNVYKMQGLACLLGEMSQNHSSMRGTVHVVLNVHDWVVEVGW